MGEVWRNILVKKRTKKKKKNQSPSSLSMKAGSAKDIYTLQGDPNQKLLIQIHMTPTKCAFLTP